MEIKIYGTWNADSVGQESSFPKLSPQHCSETPLPLVVSALRLFISHYPMKILSPHKKPEALQPSNIQFVAQLISTGAAVTAEHHAYVVVLETRFWLYLSSCGVEPRGAEQDVENPKM